MKIAAPAVLAILAFANVDAFSPTRGVPLLTTTSAATRRATTMIIPKMATEDDDENQDGAQITSARKELKFDDKTGRFFETRLETEECIPDEEFCPIDDDTGEKIRLTVAEKERIFLDALQVRFLFCDTKRSEGYGENRAVPSRTRS